MLATEDESVHHRAMFEARLRQHSTSPLHRPLVLAPAVANAQELGGRVLPEVRGAKSRAFLEQLQAEGGGPLWPDPEDPSTEAAADAIQVCT